MNAIVMKISNLVGWKANITDVFKKWLGRFKEVGVLVV